MEKIQRKITKINTFYKDSIERLNVLQHKIDIKIRDISIKYYELTRRGITKSNRENFHTNISSVSQIENEKDSLFLEYNILENQKVIINKKIDELITKQTVINNVINTFEENDIDAILSYLKFVSDSIKIENPELYNAHIYNTELYNAHINNGIPYNAMSPHTQRAAFGSVSNRGGNLNKSKHPDMSMKDIKDLCKANQIKLSKTLNNSRVVYTKKELITKLKRKKLL